MTNAEAIKMAKADLKCMERDTSGQDEMCNSHKCDECSLNYERGNMGEQKEWLRMAIQALEQEPCEGCDYKEWLKGEVKPQTGHWIWQTEDIYRCSECHEDLHVKEVMNVPQYKWCPMCGARMFEPQERSEE